MPRPSRHLGASAGLALLASALPAPAPAQNTDITASVTQGVSVATNPGLSDPADDTRLTSRTTLNVAASRQTRRESVRFSGAVGISAGTGDDREEAASLIAPRLSLGYTRAGPRLDLSLGARARVERVDEQSFFATPGAVSGTTEGPGDITLVSREGLQIDTGLSAGLGYQATARDRLSFGASVDRSDFTGEEEGGTPFEGSTDFGLTTSWSRPLDAVRTGSLSLSLNQTLSEAENADSQRANLGAGLSWTLSEDRTANAGLGLTAATGDAIDGTDLSLSGNLGAQLLLTSRDTLGLNLSQNVDPAADGRLRLSTSGSADWQHTLTARDTVSAGAAVTRQSAVGEGEDDSTLYRLSLGYSRSFGRGVSLRTGYTFRASDSGADPDHALSLTLSVPLLP